MVHHEIDRSRAGGHQQYRIDKADVVAGQDRRALRGNVFVTSNLEAVNDARRDINAVQVYPFTSGALYQVYGAPGQVTDVALQEGEQLVGSGPVAAGDTVRWIIGDTESGTGTSKRIHILVKPTRPDLVSNLVINTDRRTYLLELRSAEKTYSRRSRTLPWT